MATPMDLIAVTGTNGKTSVVSYAQQILQACGTPAASYGSLGISTADGTEPDPELPPDDQTIPALVQQLEGVAEVLIFEATSFALARGILDRLRIRTGVFTNLSHDHLDVHGGSMSVYLGAKSRLFTDILPTSGTAILGDDDASQVIAEHLTGRGMVPVRVGHGGDIVLIGCTGDPAAGSVLTFDVRGEAFEVGLPFTTGFQATNLLFALAIVTELGVSTEEAARSLAQIEHPPGRFEVISQAAGVTLIVDYAHNPNALAVALRSARELTRGRVGVVFGCGGERDRDKRAPMGRIAGQFADVVVVTDDNPRREDPTAIRHHILDACPNAAEVPDRQQAVEEALQQLEAGDVLVLAGRGDERFQEIGDERVASSDRYLLTQLLQGER